VVVHGRLWGGGGWRGKNRVGECWQVRVQSMQASLGVRQQQGQSPGKGGVLVRWCAGRSREGGGGRKEGGWGARAKVCLQEGRGVLVRWWGWEAAERWVWGEGAKGCGVCVREQQELGGGVL